MKQKKVQSRLIHKHAIEADWLKAKNFIPQQAELIVYDIEVDAEGTLLDLPEGRTEPYLYERFKIGDGTTNVNNLPFSDTSIVEQLQIKQDKLPINPSGSSNRLWLATCNKLKDADGNKRPSTIIGTLVIPRTTLGEGYLDNADISQVDIISGYHTLVRVSEIRALGQGEYIECAPKNSSITIDGVKKNTTTLTYYWTNPYHLKRVIALTDGNEADTADGPGPRTGITTASNFFAKWEAKEINALMAAHGVNELTYVSPTGERFTYDNADAYRRYLFLRYQLATSGLSEFDSATDKSRSDFYLACQNYFTSDNGFPFDIGVAADNEEPLMETLVTRDLNGRCVIEPGIYDFHAVNKKQLDSTGDKVRTDLSEVFNKSQKNQDAKIAALEKINTCLITDVLPIEEQKIRDEAGKIIGGDMRGWYRIAEAPKNGSTSNLFHVAVSVTRSTYSSDVIFNADKMDYNSHPSIGVLSFSSRNNADVIDKIRIVYVKAGSAATAQPAYLEVHINKTANPVNAWDGTSTSTAYNFKVETLMNSAGQNWTLVDPFLVADKIDVSEVAWASYEKTPTDTSWSNVTRTVDDINDLATREYVNEKITEMATIKERIIALEAQLSGIETLLDKALNGGVE